MVSPISLLPSGYERPDETIEKDWTYPGGRWEGLLRGVSISIYYITHIYTYVFAFYFVLFNIMCD